MQMNNKKNLAVIQNSLGLFPLLFILAMFVLPLALPGKTYSQKERRYFVL
jgi:hypothetical protein